MYDHARHHRRSLRLPGYDYALTGAYYVTICTHERACLFGQLMDDVVHLSEYGDILADAWRGLPLHHAGVETGPAVIMPNHLHGIILIAQAVAPRDHRGPGPQSSSVGAIVGGLKAAVARRINIERGTPGGPVWQSNYYEHVVRDDDDWARICHYIEMNPATWAGDPENL